MRTFILHPIGYKTQPDTLNKINSANPGAPSAPYYIHYIHITSTIYIHNAPASSPHLHCCGTIFCAIGYSGNRLYREKYCARRARVGICVSN